MTTTATDALNSVYTPLAELGAAETYRFPTASPVFPAFLIQPSAVDLRAAHGGVRRFAFTVEVTVEVRDEESSLDELQDLLEQAVEALFAADIACDIGEVTYGRDATADGRNIIFYELPVVVITS